MFVNYKEINAGVNLQLKIGSVAGVIGPIVLGS